MEKAEKPLALVSGSGHRLGRAFALRLAGMGYAILLHYHNSGIQAAETEKEIRKFDVPVFVRSADLADPAGILDLFNAVDKLGSPLQVLVNSAAVMPRGDLHDLSLEEWDAALDLNLRAPFLLAQQAAARMKNGGVIVNISDVGARKNWTGFPAYTVSKSGLETLTRLQARAYAPAVRVNAIAPGLVLPSPETKPEEWQRLVDRLPLKRSVAIDELAAALEFILRSPSMTGQTLVVDGGYSLL